VSEPVDLIVDGGVLLDEGVGLWDVRLGLVVVVVGDEVLHPVVGEELAELVGELGAQRLVGGEDQRRLLDLLDGPGDGGRLARTGDAEQRLELVAPVDPFGQRRDRLRLITGRREVGDGGRVGATAPYLRLRFASSQEPSPLASLRGTKRGWTELSGAEPRSEIGDYLLDRGP
jgi:hypothetical protein